MKRIVRVLPHDCPDTARWLVTGAGRRLRDDKTRAIRRLPFHRRHVVHQGSRIPRETYSPDRCTHRSVGRKGEGKFKQISWDRSAGRDRRAAVLKVLSAEDPANILPCSICRDEGWCSTCR